MSSFRRKIAAGVASLAILGAAAGAWHDAEPFRVNRALGPGSRGDVVPPDASGADAAAGPVTGALVTPGLSRPLRSLVPGPTLITPWVKRELTRAAEGEAGSRAERASARADGALQTARGASQMPAPVLSFGGMSYKANGPVRLVPPDTNGDVGLTRYVQAVNTRFAVFNKTTGARVAGPTTISSLFRSAGSTAKLCSTHDDGDPVVVYDEQADRWVLTQFALNFRANVFAECIAVSRTSAAAGSYFVYQFKYLGTNAFNDYPKLGVWPDGYYASFNEFDPVTEASKGVGVVAYDRANMIQGFPAGQIYLHEPVSFNLASMLPSDLDGGTPPPAGAPNLFVQMDPEEIGYPQDQLEIWAFHADFNGGSSTFDPIYDQTNGIATAPFSPFVCGSSTSNCIAQRGTPKKLDAIPDRLMFRLQYRNLGTDDQRLTVAQTVRASSGRAGVRWYVLKGDDAFTTWSILGQGTYAPADTRSRWMGSAALDKDGNLAIGYSLSGPATYPSISYAGAPAADLAAGMLTFGERRGFTGTGSEVGSYHRWGDYADLTVDPVDGCTFYFTTQYYGTTGQFGWRTRVVAFKQPTCT